MSENKIVCRRTSRDAFRRDDQIIRATETDVNRSGIFLSYCENRKMAWVFWNGATEETQVPLASIMHIGDWKAAREKQAKLKDYWK